MQNNAAFFPPTCLIPWKKIETSWEELDVFLWENYLGSSYEQEEKAWDYRNCAAFLTSSVIRKTEFMLPPTSSIWHWCSLQISMLLIPFLLQALCSCMLVGVEPGQVSSRMKVVLTQISLKWSSKSKALFCLQVRSHVTFPFLQRPICTVFHSLSYGICLAVHLGLLIWEYLSRSSFVLGTSAYAL